MENSNTSSASIDFADLEAKLTTAHPWVKTMMKNMQETVSHACLKWCKILVAIGEPEDRIEECVNVFHSYIDDLCKDMITDMELYQDKICDKLETLMKNFETVCKDLKEPMPVFDLQTNTTPLIDMQRHIQERFVEYEKLASTRKKEVEILNKNLSEICVALGRAPPLLPVSPLPSAEEVDQSREHLEKLETEKMEREETFFKFREEIVAIASELGAIPELDYERRILGLSDSEVLISDEDLDQLQSYHKRLQRTAENVETEINELRLKIDAIWNKLEIDMLERNEFLKTYTGKSFQTLEALRTELSRCDAFKKANLKTFIEKLRVDLDQLWARCRAAEELRNEFLFYDTDFYTEDLLELHEREIAKWTRFYESNEVIFSTLDKFEKLWEEMGQLEESSRSTNRYQNRGGELLKEEKLRNKLTKSIPKLEEKLLALADSFREKNGREFLNFGKPIDEYIANLHDERELQFKTKLKEKKLRDKTPVKLQTTLKRKLVTPSPVPLLKKSRTVSVRKNKVASNSKKTATAGPKVQVSINRRQSRHRRRLRLSLLKCEGSSFKENQSTCPDYHTFTNDISSECRSSVNEPIPGPSGTQVPKFASISTIKTIPPTPTSNRHLRDFNFKTPNRLPVSTTLRFK